MAARTVKDSSLTLVHTMCPKMRIPPAPLRAGSIPSWTGSEQARPFTFAHGRLIIGAGNRKLTWERAVQDA